MKKALNTERKRLLSQVAVLVLACILFMIVGRILAGNRFEMSISLGYYDEPEKAEEIKVGWEGDKAMTVKELSVTDKNNIILVLEPDGPGDYVMEVTGREGRMILYDRLHVDALGTTHSMQSRNFTGDNAFVGGIATLVV